MRSRFDKQLNQLNNNLLEMGALTEQAIESAVRALSEQDENAARGAIELEREIDSQERAVESLCLKLLLEQQPVAGDLRLISAALKMITDLERIGDQAADIAEIILRLRGQSYIKPLIHLPQMAARTIEMVTGSIDALVQKDLEKTKSIFELDDLVDELFRIVKNELVELIRKDASCSEQAIDLLMIAKYFERIGDHAQNIAEWVEFSLTGVHKNGEKE
ncbi:phosphate signaling complex protein PhoU [Pyramidobacter sp. CG50-2]|uniref:phosphate signaling complex protein PhoU n=1 Tax=Pyramidobacter sp. CG50-2 TaxID=2382160 RepID=UPI000EA08CC1|nr:phosphate signaling complex protein PhoU [Pyramidobacter sp. CG50-2]RKJ81461.1 phosphate transport system regulatory protein PhoU [Pyramidobacter sp. CG50-2]